MEKTDDGDDDDDGADSIIDLSDDDDDNGDVTVTHDIYDLTNRNSELSSNDDDEYDYSYDADEIQVLTEHISHVNKSPEIQRNNENANDDDSEIEIIDYDNDGNDVMKDNMMNDDMKQTNNENANETDSIITKINDEIIDCGESISNERDENSDTKTPVNENDCDNEKMKCLMFSEVMDNEELNLKIDDNDSSRSSYKSYDNSNETSEIPNAKNHNENAINLSDEICDKINSILQCDSKLQNERSLNETLNIENEQRLENNYSINDDALTVTKNGNIQTPLDNSHESMVMIKEKNQQENDTLNIVSEKDESTSILCPESNVSIVEENNDEETHINHDESTDISYHSDSTIISDVSTDATIDNCLLNGDSSQLSGLFSAQNDDTAESVINDNSNVINENIELNNDSIQLEDLREKSVKPKTKAEIMTKLKSKLKSKIIAKNEKFKLKSKSKKKSESSLSYVQKFIPYCAWTKCKSKFKAFDLPEHIKHQAEVHSHGTHRCEIKGCSFKARTDMILLRHKEFHRAIDELYKDTNDDHDDRNMDNDSDETFECTVMGCPMEFTDIGSFYKHDFNHRLNNEEMGLKPHKCIFPKCKFKAANIIELTYHNNTHFGQFLCDFDFCSHSFKSQKELDDHKKTHTHEMCIVHELWLMGKKRKKKSSHIINVDSVAF